MNTVPIKPTFWRRLVTDTETKKQLVTVAFVALFVSAFEVIFFYTNVVPSIQESVRSMVTPKEPSAMDPAVRTRLDTVLQVLHENERRLIESNNAATVVYAVLILCLPVMAIVVLWVSSQTLRRASWRSIRFDVGVMTASIVAFQLYFYFFSRGWRYPSNHQIAVGISEEYRRRAEESGGYDPSLANDTYNELLPPLMDLLARWDGAATGGTATNHLVRLVQTEGGRLGR